MNCSGCSNQTHYVCIRCKSAVCNRPACSTPSTPDTQGYSEDHPKAVAICFRCNQKNTTQPTGRRSITSFFSNKPTASTSSKPTSSTSSVLSPQPSTTKSKRVLDDSADNNNPKKLKTTVLRKDEVKGSRSTGSDINEHDLGENIIIAFQNIFHDVDISQIHTYYTCKSRNCTEICEEDRAKMTKDKKFKHKWLFDPELAFCERSHKWCLTYIDGKGMFCALCRMHNTKHSNDGKVWNSSPNVRCRTETIKSHMGSKTSIHNQAVASDTQQKGSYFVKEMNKNVALKDAVYEKVFRALYWLAKEEIATSKITSLLELLEKMGVDDMKYFQTRSEPVLREMALLLSEVIVEDLIERIKSSEGFGLLVDEVTDISNVQQLVTFIKFFDNEKGRPSTVFTDVTDLLEESEDTSPNSKAIFNCLLNILKKLDLKLLHLKAFSSDGASVMTGCRDGVATKFRQLQECRTMINVHCICHRLALACADTGDELKFINVFELVLTQLWKFFKDSPKRLKIYIKVAMQSKNFETMSKRKKKKIVHRVKKACRTRWLSLHASVNAVHEEYAGILNALRLMSEENSVMGNCASGLLKKIDSFSFLSTLYLMKVMLPHLTTLSKTFQTGALNFSRVIPNIQKTKSKIMAVVSKDEPLVLLEKDIMATGRLGICQIEVTEHMKQSMRRNTKNYATSICTNIDERFPESAQETLSAFAVFDLDSLPADPSSHEFNLYGEMEMRTLHHQFFPNNELSETQDQWKDFKFELLQLKRKWNEYKRQMSDNKLKLKQTPSEWAISRIVNAFKEDPDYDIIVQMAKIACVTPVTNAWPERGASAIKRIKSRSRNSMKNDLLNALLHISINGPDVNSSDASKLIEKACLKFQQTGRYKRPNILVTRSVLASTSTQTTPSTLIEDEEPLEAHLEHLLQKESTEELMITHFEGSDSDSESESVSSGDD